MPDKNFEQNLRGGAGRWPGGGGLFFSQAVSVWEAEEEAQYVLDAIQGYDVTYPWPLTGSSLPGTRAQDGRHGAGGHHTLRRGLLVI